MSYRTLDKGDPEFLRVARLVMSFVFGNQVNEGDTLGRHQYAAVFAYKTMLDMHLESQQALMILQFFKKEIAATWAGVKPKPLILSLNDGRYAVVITEPECRRIYDYRDCIDRTHPTQAIPLPAPVVQASVNLSKAIELGL